MTPLARRLPREFRHNLGKYVGLFFLICLSISMVSGFLVAARSIQRVVADTRAASNLQDFSVTTQFRMPDEALSDLRASHGGIDVAEDFYADLDLTYRGLSSGKDVTARVYGERKKIDKVTYEAGLYYHSYSLPTFHAYFDPATFVETTIVPLALLALITYAGIRRKLNATPLSFLRHEVGHQSRRSAARLPERWPFARRFRMRVFLRNVSHFAVLFLGIVLSSLLMVFGLAMLPIVHHAANQMASSVRADHVYVLKAPLEIGEASRQEASRQREAGSAEKSVVEKFSVTSLELARPDGNGTESVSVYGVKVGSDYWDDVDVSGGKIVIGKGLVEKYGFQLGRTVRLANKFTGDRYVLAPTEVAGNETDTNIYMSRATFAEVFPEVTGGDAAYFNGYASDQKLDLDERYVLSETTPEDMRVLADQMDTSMGDIMNAMLWLAIPISIVLIYLLTKTVIDRSARYISYMKVFGFREREIQGLYLRPVTWTVIGSYVLSIPLVIWLAKLFLREYLVTYSGNIELVVEPQVMAESLAIGIATYLVVAAVHVLRIRRVSLSLALRVQE